VFSQKLFADENLSDFTGFLALHRREEFVIGFGVLELVDQELYCLCVFHRMQKLTQYPHMLEFFFFG
jgi:hypothetical protein